MVGKTCYTVTYHSFLHAPRKLASGHSQMGMAATLYKANGRWPLKRYSVNFQRNSNWPLAQSPSICASGALNMPIFIINPWLPLWGIKLRMRQIRALVSSSFLWTWFVGAKDWIFSKAPAVGHAVMFEIVTVIPSSFILSVIRRSEELGNFKGANFWASDHACEMGTRFFRIHLRLIHRSDRLGIFKVANRLGQVWSWSPHLFLVNQSPIFISKFLPFHEQASRAQRLLRVLKNGSSGCARYAHQQA